MALSPIMTSFNDQDIDPNSTLVIRLCIRSIARSRAQSFSSTSEQPQTLGVDPSQSLAVHVASHGKAKAMPGDMTRDRVMAMSPNELVLLHKRVQQLELSNYGLLRRIYGAQISANPYIQFTGQTPSADDTKSEAYRIRLFEQYQSMMADARSPRFPDLEPVSAESVRLLQLFESEYARATSPAQNSSRQQSPKSPITHKSMSELNWVRGSARVDKQVNQAYKARLQSLHAGGTHASKALTDYQIQLMMLEEQNQKRLTMMRIQREHDQSHTFDPILYEAQLAAIKVTNDRRLEMQNFACAGQIASPVETDESSVADTAMSNSVSPLVESIETPWPEERATKLLSRSRSSRRELST
jgi:hypothetical protein